MKVTLLGTGTSTGVPVAGCRCEVCLSSDPKNNRLRTSAYVEIQAKDRTENSSDPASQPKPDQVVAAILIDTGPDFRYQALRYSIRRIDAVLYTHAHADHIFGIDDLRPFNFLQKSIVPLYAGSAAAADMRRIFSYCFEADDNYEGGSQPELTLNEIYPGQAIELCGVSVLPLKILHGQAAILGFRMGNFAYLTDCSAIPPETSALLTGLEVLVLDGLRERPHRTHFTIAEAAAEAEALKPAQTYLTHISHELEHQQTNEKLKSLATVFVELAYDGLVIEL